MDLENTTSTRVNYETLPRSGRLPRLRKKRKITDFPIGQKEGDFTMITHFINNTEKTIIIELRNQKLELNSGDKIQISTETNNLIFNCYLKDKSSFKYLPFSKSVIIEYNFILNSLYNLTLYNDVNEINFLLKTAKGNNLDWYKFVDLQISDGVINSKDFSVQDELSARNELSSAQGKEQKLNRKLKIIDVLQSVCYIGIPAFIIFFGIWYFADFKTALSILVPLAIIGTLIGLLIKKIINKFNNKLDKINSKFENESKKNIDINLFFDKSYIDSIICN